MRNLPIEVSFYVFTILPCLQGYSHPIIQIVSYLIRFTPYARLITSHILSTFLSQGTSKGKQGYICRRPRRTSSFTLVSCTGTVLIARSTIGPRRSFGPIALVQAIVPARPG